jgi:hypothetical protein
VSLGETLVSVQRSLLAGGVVAACLAGAAGAALEPDPRAKDAVGDLRVLVIRATWGPPVLPAAAISRARPLSTTAHPSGSSG